MAYIGRSPQYGVFQTQTITPDGSTTFSLSYPVATEASMIVSVGGVIQQPSTAYTISNGGTQIVFSEAPDVGLDVFIIFMGEKYTVGTLSDNYVTAGMLQSNSVTTAKIADGSVTAAKLGTVYAANITGIDSIAVANTQITGKLTSSQIVSVANTQVTGIQTIAQGGTNNATFTSPSGSVSGLVFYNGTGLVNDSTVTDVGYDTSSHTLRATNLTVSGDITFSGGNVNVTGPFIETANVMGVPSATQAYPLSLNSLSFHTANATSNVTANLTGLNSLSSNTTSTFAIGVKNGATPYYISGVQIDGTTSNVTTYWQGSVPTGGNASCIDLYTFTVLKTGVLTYTVLGAQSKFTTS